MLMCRVIALDGVTLPGEAEFHAPKALSTSKPSPSSRTRTDLLLSFINGSSAACACLKAGHKSCGTFCSEMIPGCKCLKTKTHTTQKLSRVQASAVRSRISLCENEQSVLLAIYEAGLPS